MISQLIQSTHYSRYKIDAFPYRPKCPYTMEGKGMEGKGKEWKGREGKERDRFILLPLS
jgi:hypothetical protein